jgi:Lar family restriction alleviation protein
VRQSKTQLNQLKPCPFCGSMAVLKYAVHDGLEYSSASCSQVGTCPASGGFSPQQSKQEASEKWNRRVK